MNQLQGGGGYCTPSINATTLEQLGIVLSCDGGNLRIKAPTGVITPEIRTWLSENKASLLAALQSPAWDATDWQAFYDERAGIAEYDGGLSRADAERMAYEHCLVQWLNTNAPTNTSPDICLHCGKATNSASRAVLNPTSDHFWLHDKCYLLWLAHRKKQVVEALAEMGIAMGGAK